MVFFVIFNTFTGCYECDKFRREMSRNHRTREENLQSVISARNKAMMETAIRKTAESARRRQLEIERIEKAKKSAERKTGRVHKKRDASDWIAYLPRSSTPFDTSNMSRIVQDFSF